MSSKNDPASGSDNKFLENHDKLKAGLTNPAVVALNISPADQATITADNVEMHAKKSTSDQADGAAQQATKDKDSSIGTGKTNYRLIRQHIMKAPGYTQAIGELLGIERAQATFAATMSADGPAPVLRGKALDTGGAELKSNKGDAEAVDIYGKRDTDADFVKLDRVLHFPWVDTRPLLVAGKPEKREYKAKFIRQNQPYGNMSNTLTLIVSA